MRGWRSKARCDALGLRVAGADALAETSAPVLDWIAKGIEKIAIHFDVDVLDPKKFGPTLFNKPGRANGFS